MIDCLFCGIVEGKVPANIVYQDDSVVVFKDIRPRAPVHFLIIPRKHIVSVLDIDPNDGALVGQIFQVAARLAREHGVAESGFRVVVNVGADAGQSVFHLHYHLLGGRQMSWPPG
ncbi:MAG TPA: histidine triad nucleotide-binding protein [Candidatus Binatia bacterium]|jgi:histidine triad (HIT) family protein|nr:histidine triad nucleotide-binding protein [Candidatus Binatia bacterium]